MPFCALNGLAGFLVLDGLAGGDTAGGDRIAIRHKSCLWILPEVADEDDFVDALALVDVLLLMPVYAAGEEPLHDADSAALARALRNKGLVEPIMLTAEQSLFAALENIMLADDLVLTMGAGSIGRLAQAAFDQFTQGVSHHVS